MTAVPSPPTWTTLSTVTLTKLNQITDCLTFLLNPPIAQLRQTSAQSLSNGILTSIQMNAEDKDSVNGHDNVTNNSRYTAVYAGQYEVCPGVGYAANATGARTAQLAKNGSVVSGSQTKTNAVSGGIDTAVAGRTIHVFLNVGDYVEVQAFQNSGGALNTGVSGSEEQSQMMVRWVSN